ncbi:hypothetical protein PIROE2DRAFT_3505 [Piromyces sp. E2]|nr:hypothetical protein PIROE2DRAFT_3505 [Piromyces sp. E2]|eukprot:OUM68665.1 hypothetical protein PIROE2DRAFT_3505 [Piromyces sp. E2]
MSSQGNLSGDDLASRRSSNTKKVVKKVIKKKSPLKDDDEGASHLDSKPVSKIDLTDSNIINYKIGQVSTMTTEDIEKILGDKERLLGELYTAELEIDRLEEENQVLRNTIDEQKQTISKLLITNNENQVHNSIPILNTNNLDDDAHEKSITVISSNNEDIEKEKLLKKIEALEVANEHLKGQNEELLGVIQSSEEEIERLENELRNVKSSSKIELTKTKIENNKLKSSIEELENKVESIASIEKENEELKNSIESLEQKNESLAEVERENNELRSSLENLEDKDKIIDDLQNDNQELKLSLESVKDEITKINQKDKEIELLQRENDILRRENEELLIANNELQATINELTANSMKQAEELARKEQFNNIIPIKGNSKLGSRGSLGSGNKNISTEEVRDSESELEAHPKEDIADNNSNISGSNNKNLSVCSSSISLLKCSVPELIKEIKDLKKCVYYINKQKKDLEKKLQDATTNKIEKTDDNQNENENILPEDNNPPICENEIDKTKNNNININNNVNNSTQETFTLQELQGIIEGMDKEIMNTRKIKAQFDEQENSIIDLKRELLKYSRNKEERVRNIGRALNTDFSNLNSQTIDNNNSNTSNSNINNNLNNNNNNDGINYMNNNINSNNNPPFSDEVVIKACPKTRNDRNNLKLNSNDEDNNMMDNFYFKVQLQNDKTKLQNQLSNAKKTIHQLKKLCDGLSSELENYRNNFNNDKENTTSFSLDIKENRPSRSKHSHSHSCSKNRTSDKRSSSLGRNYNNPISSSNNLTSNNPKNNCNYYISINDNVSTTNNSNGTSSVSGSSSTSKNNSTYDSMSYYSSSHGYGDNNSLISGSSLTTTSNNPKEKINYGHHSRRSQSTSRYNSKYYDNNNTTDIMMLINERDKEREHRLNRDLNTLQNKFQDLLKSYQSIKNERDVISNELISNPSPVSSKQERHHHSHSHSRHRKQSESSVRGRSQSPTKRKHHSNEKDDASNGHLRSCSTHTNGIKVEVYT